MRHSLCRIKFCITKVSFSLVISFQKIKFYSFEHDIFSVVLSRHPVSPLAEVSLKTLDYGRKWRCLGTCPGCCHILTVALIAVRWARRMRRIQRRFQRCKEPRGPMRPRSAVSSWKDCLQARLWASRRAWSHDLDMHRRYRFRRPGWCCRVILRNARKNEQVWGHWSRMLIWRVTLPEASLARWAFCSSAPKPARSFARCEGLPCSITLGAGTGTCGAYQGRGTKLYG